MSEVKIIKLWPRLCKKGKDHHGPFLVDPSAKEVECEGCGKKMDPMAVLITLSAHESSFQKRLDNLREAWRRHASLRCPHCTGNISLQGKDE